ncbi:MAG: CocE/NonD family hydrolase C-terminal non-catalytic domain-containing protein [Solirubrobacterales bacterium]
MIAVAACFAWALVAGTPAHATVASSLYAISSCDADTGTAGTADPQVPHPGHSYFFCDDGVPTVGGLTANLTGASAITVPSIYGGDGYTGLPPAAGQMADPGADMTGHISLDVDVTLPGTAPPAGGYPMVFMMHGCCSGNKKSFEATSFDAGGERWHYSNAWFASRGYVVVNYTGRGFYNSATGGSTGQTELDSRSFEINDYQSLACQVISHDADWGAINGQNAAFQINPDHIVTTGGSYGGGFSWMALTDPKWTCDADSGASGTNVKLAASAPKYGWTDLLYSLVPNGRHGQLPGELPATNGCDDGPLDLDGNACAGGGAAIGVPKKSIVNALYLSGTGALGADRTTFGTNITDAIGCLNGDYPFDPVGPLCATTLSTTLPEFMRERSAYYQNDFFTSIATDPSYRVPVFNAATLTDPLFPASENRTMANRLLSVVPDYPIKQYYGDYQHFTQNKAKGWGDICGGDHHVCAFADYPSGNVNADPAGFARAGVTTRLNRFVDNYAQPAGGYAPATPDFDVTADVYECPTTSASQGLPADEPGPAFTAGSFEALAPKNLALSMSGTQTTTSPILVQNLHAGLGDPFNNQVANQNKCRIETAPASAGNAVYTSDPLSSQVLMIGATRVKVDFQLTAPPGDAGFQLNSRLYDVYPDGKALLIDRGPRRLSTAEAASGQVTYELHGQAYRFLAGHQIRIEIAQDDDPFMKRSSVSSSATLSGVTLDMPTREVVESPGGSAGTNPPSTAPSASTAKKKCKKGKKGKKASAAKKKRKACKKHKKHKKHKK